MLHSSVSCLRIRNRVNWNGINSRTRSHHNVSHVYTFSGPVRQREWDLGHLSRSPSAPSRHQSSDSSANRDDDQGSYTVSSIRALDSRRSLGLKQSLDCKLCLLQMHLYARSGQSTKDPGPWNWTSSICSEMGHRRWMIFRKHKIVQCGRTLIVVIRSRLLTWVGW